MRLLERVQHSICTGFVQCADAVSYTHLDVYKRQTQNGNHIGKRLGRVQMTAVAGIDDRHRRVQ